ncbi:MAG: hypothetical protein ACMUIP_12960, partial [bacterium]
MRAISVLFLLVIMVCAGGCEHYKFPPEVTETEMQKISLRRADAQLYAPDEFKKYLWSLGKADEHLQRVQRKFFLFRNYKSVQMRFEEVLQEGEELGEKIRQEKKERAFTIENKGHALEKELDSIRKSIKRINE